MDRTTSIQMPLTPMVAALFLALTADLMPGVASAHAVVQDSNPANDAVVAPDTEVRLRFNSRIDHARSRLSLASGKAEAVTVPLAADASPDTLAARLSGLAPGPYRLLWQVLSVDGHVTRGEIRFSVRKP